MGGKICSGQEKLLFITPEEIRNHLVNRTRYQKSFSKQNKVISQGIAFYPKLLLTWEKS